MTLLYEREGTCYVCGAVHPYTRIASTNESGASDLDGRPPEMLRSTMPYWIQRCPGCGYCAPDVSVGSHRVKEIVASRAYEQRIHDASYTELANSFRGWALIQETLGQDAEAGWAYVRAAWACDDGGRGDAARLCRQAAVQAFRRSRSVGATFAEELGAEEALLADLLRRSGDFDAAIQVGEEGLRREPDEALRQVLLYERALARRKDPRRYRVSDALRCV